MRVLGTFTRSAQIHFVVPGTAIGGTGNGPNSYLAGRRSSFDFITCPR